MQVMHLIKIWVPKKLMKWWWLKKIKIATLKIKKKNYHWKINSTSYQQIVCSKNLQRWVIRQLYLQLLQKTLTKIATWIFWISNKINKSILDYPNNKMTISWNLKVTTMIIIMKTWTLKKRKKVKKIAKKAKLKG